MNIADRLLSPDWRFHPSAQPNIISLYGLDEFKAWARALVNAIPDFRATIHDTVAEADLSLCVGRSPVRRRANTWERRRAAIMSK